MTTSLRKMNRGQSKIKHFPPDVRACEVLLKAKRPTRWILDWLEQDAGSQIALSDDEKRLIVARAAKSVRTY